MGKLLLFPLIVMFSFLLLINLSQKETIIVEKAETFLRLDMLSVNFNDFAIFFCH